MAYRHGRWWWLHLVIFFSLPFRCSSWADPLSCSLSVPSNPLLSSNSLILTLKLQLYGCFGPTFAFLHLNIFPISDDLLFYVPLIFFFNFSSVQIFCKATTCKYDWFHCLLMNCRVFSCFSKNKKQHGEEKL
jgi:hypothetical protein